MCNQRLLVVAAALLSAVVFLATPVLAGGRHHHSGWRGGSHSSSSYYNNYNSYYYNPYSYEAQNRPYWMQPSYRSGSGTYAYSAPAARPDRYGAIAYSRSTGTYGYSYSQYSQADAEREALNQCDASDREVIGWMRNAYGALAVGDDTNQYGWAWGATSAAAQQAALAKCQERTTNCRISVTVFSGN